MSGDAVAKLNACAAIKRLVVRFPPLSYKRAGPVGNHPPHR